MTRFWSMTMGCCHPNAARLSATASTAAGVMWRGLRQRHHRHRARHRISDSRLLDHGMASVVTLWHAYAALDSTADSRDLPAQRLTHLCLD